MIINSIRHFFFFLFAIFILSSCEFKCEVGNVKNKKASDNRIDEQPALIYNNIQVEFHKIRLLKTYLIDKNERKIPNDNKIDLDNRISLIILTDSNWTKENGKVWLGASQKIIVESSGEVLLDEKDLFNSSEGLTVSDASGLALKAIFEFKKKIPPTNFRVSFRVWDKKGPAYIEGYYNLYSK
jgi:hypothetical protein